jgi:hypothetical protein
MAKLNPRLEKAVATLGRAMAGPQAPPGQPWLRREDWAAGRIEYDETTWAAGLLSWFMFAVPFVGLVFAVRLILRGVQVQGADPRVAIAVVLAVFGGGSLWMFRKAIQATSARRRGTSVFEMAHVPAAPGGRLEGVVRTRAVGIRGRGARVSLRCGERVGSGNYLGPYMRYPEDCYGITREVWKDKQEIDRARIVDTGGTIGIPISFAIPAKPPQTDHFAGGGAITWELTVRIPSAGYYARFHPPVFKPGAGRDRMDEIQ